MTQTLIKKEELEQIFSNQIQIIDTLRDKSEHLATLTKQSGEKFKTARENFMNASKNILKIKKDMEFMHKAIKKIAIYQANFEKSRQSLSPILDSNPKSNQESLITNNENLQQEKESLEPPKNTEKLI